MRRPEKYLITFDADCALKVFNAGGQVLDDAIHSQAEIVESDLMLRGRRT